MSIQVKALAPQELEERCREDARKQPEMTHYFEKWRDHMMKKSEKKCDFDQEFAQFEEDYFKDSPPMVKITTEMSLPIKQRMMACMWYTK